MHIHITGLLIGFIIGAIDCGIIILSGPVTIPDFVSALFVWTMVGWAIHTSADMPIHPVIKAVVISWFFNIPWLIEFTVIHEQPNFFIPIIMMATIFGTVIGFLSQWAKRREPTVSSVT
ncbi:MAG: hypothetical protein HRU22_04270 [Gammaproteobacteria bacterium]|nr:hypothetical protein [Gammaproteobacteria bacterium]